MTLLHALSAGGYGTLQELKRQINLLDQLDTDGPLADSWRTFVQYSNPWMSDVQMQRYQDRVQQYQESRR